jgi:hypothetical protein
MFLARYFASAAIVISSILFNERAIAQEGYADIRPEPGGTRLFCVSGTDVRPDPNGKRLLFIDGDTLRTEPGGPRILFVDGDDIRPAPGGIRLAFLDGKFLRRSPGGPILLFIDGQDVRPDQNGPRLLFLDGGPLSRPQLIAALYHWKPELFKLGDAEQAALKAEMEKNAKAAEEAARNKFVGNFSILNSNAQAFRSGTVSIAKLGDYYTLTFTLAGDQKWYGVAQKRTVKGEEEYWVAASPTGAIGLGIYELEGTGLKGQWIPLAAATQGTEVLGEETATGASTFTGNYNVAGKFTMKLGDYKGTMALAAFPADNASVVLEPRMIQWTVGGKRWAGIGTLVESEPGKKALVAASGTDPHFFVGRLKETSSSGVHIDFCVNQRSTGFILLDKSAQ